jgi:hypothetical protein
MQIADSFRKLANSPTFGRPHLPQVSTFAARLLFALALLNFCVLTYPTLSRAQSTNKPVRDVAISGPKDDIKEAEKLANQGDKAVAAGKMREGLANYSAAVKAAPGNLNIARRASAVRAQVVQTIVDHAEGAALDGNLILATDLLNEALRIDPGNTIVAERLNQMKQMRPEYLPAGDKEDYELKGPATLKPQSGKKPINVRGDSKSAYEQVAKMFGITVAFDPDLTSKNIKLRLDSADFYTAMQLIGAESKTFFRVVNPTLLFVAEDTIAKRKDYSEEVEQTFRLDNAVANEDLTDMVRVLREITNSTRISSNPANHSLTIRETADKVALAGQLIRELEQARRDVLLDIELLEVDRNAARTIGVTPPSNVQAFPLNTNDVRTLENATDITNLLTLVAQVFTSRGITASPTDVLPVGGGKSTFLLTMPSASATFSQGLSLVHSGREILMRAQDSKPATFFVGTRYPVTLSLLSTSLGGTTVGGAVTSTVFARTDFATGANPVSVVAQDFNNDAKPDIAVTNKADSSISVFLNNDNGNFTVAPNSPIKLGTNETLPTAIASKILRATDATHLAQPGDLVIANSGSNTVSVLLGSQNFDGTFTEAPGSPFAVGAQPSAVVIADFNGDGNLDIAVANQGDNTISIFSGDSLGNFVPFSKSPFVLPANDKGPIAMVNAQFDNSGKPEIAVLNAASQTIAIFQASGDSTFDGTFAQLSGSPLATGSNPVAFAAGDLNADGFADFAIVNQSSNAVTILLNDGTGVFTQAPGSPLQTASTPSGVAIADFTNDGLADIAVTNSGSSTLGVYANLSSGLFSPRIELTTPPGPLAITTATLTTTGLPDAILTSTSGSSNFLTVLLDPSTFASGGGTVQTPYPGSEYVDLGIKVKATPSVHDNNEVTLQLEFEIRALSGNNVNGIPIITNRTITQTVRLKENEPSLIAGLLDEEETRSLTGIPGLANLPGVGLAFGQRTRTEQDTELLIVVTPRRMSDHSRNSITRWVGHSDIGSAGSSAQSVPEP